MEQRPSADRRKHARQPLATAVRFHHASSNREYPAHSVDISAGGMLMYAPVGAPVSPGQRVRLTIGPIPQPELAELGDGPVEATIIHVDRQRLLHLGYLPVGVQFTKLMA